MIDNNNSYTDACVQGNNPPCTCTCPLNFNSRVFISKLKKGGFDAAYRDYANKVIFPAIVSRICSQNCMGLCPEKISMLALEQACVNYASKKDPINFNLPARKGSIAIIGGGISGLACALRLATRKYNVTVYECSAVLGGSLKEVMDEAVYEEEFALQFKYLTYTLEKNHEITSLDELNCDAVYIATGSGGRDFDLLKSWDRASMATGRDGVFLGGKLTGSSNMSALMQGMIAAASIEKYLKVGSMSGQPETFLRTEECTLPLLDIEHSRQIMPVNGEYFSEEEVVLEASRCINCDCTFCKDSCEFLKNLDMFPRKVETDAKMAKAAQEGLLDRVGTRMIVSCSVCGHCGAVCPENINVEDIMIDSKKVLFEYGRFAPPFHDFYLRDMSIALKDTYVAKAAPDYEKATYMFFPGCQMTASGTELVEKAYRYLLSKYPDTALMMACCGVPALWAGDHSLLNQVLEQLKGDWQRLGKPKLVIACSTCAKTFTTYLSEVEWISLYEFICEKGLPEDAAAINGQWAVFDPCSSRKFPNMQQSIRKLAQRLGANLTELPNSGNKALCCGMGGHIYPANPKIFHKMLLTAAGQSELPYITYCTNCRNLFLHAGKSNRHILDNIFGVDPLAKPFHIAELKKNRLALKKRLLENYWGENLDIMEKKYTVKLKISEEILNKMDKMHISEEDVYEVVEFCEQHNQTVLNKETHILTGHLQIGIITYWVQFKREEEYINIHNVYCHRLQLS